MNFIGYTYKADVEEQRSMLVNVLKDLGNISDADSSPTNAHSQYAAAAQQQQQMQYQPQTANRPNTAGYQQ